MKKGSRAPEKSATVKRVVGGKSKSPPSPSPSSLPSSLAFRREPGGFCAAKKQKRVLTCKSLVAAENFDLVPASVPTFVNIASGPSTLPLRRYCDLSGVECAYTDPVTKLHYANAAMCGVLRALPAEVVNELRSLRGEDLTLR
jgi:hypothetical protein